MFPQILVFLKSLEPFFAFAWQFIEAWWWLALPFILWKPFTFFWRWWRIDLFLAKQKSLLLEIRMPKEELKPIRAMEIVMDSLHKIIYKPPDWWEKWIDGEVQLSYAFEITSIGGETHFYIRIPAASRDPVEAAFFSQYPEAEFLIAEDYTKNVPQDIPNKEWELFASDYRPLKENPYPIKTYVKFETEREVPEEKRIDPVAQLLESMAKIKPGEQFWLQILAEPVTNGEEPWITEGKKIRDELAKRVKKTEPKHLLLEAADILITGQTPGEAKKEEPLFPPEMKLTPGEKDIITGVEQKMSKPGFKTSIRFIFLGRKDVYFKANWRFILGFLGSYATENLNALVPLGKTLTKIHKSWFFPLNYILKRRLYLRQRKIFRLYQERYNPFYPLPPKFPSTFVLNTEELASLFHFPSRRVAQAPYVRRIEAKKGEAPFDLPTE